MHNVKLTIAYDGTDFHGWQIQAGKPTIQGAITDVLRRITQEAIFLHGAGRTDAGVHALGQVAHFKTQSALSPGEFQRALNALLPPAIRVGSAEEVGPDFHARWQALSKTYRYRIYRGRVVPPTEWRYILHYPFPLDLDSMRQACSLYAGTHDFASFAGSTGSEEGDSERTTVREIFEAQLAEAEQGEELHFTVRGKSFLRYMVRKMVGTLLDVGRSKLQPADVERLYQIRDRSKAGPTVPPQGLWMVAVEYPEPWRIAGKLESRTPAL